MQREARIQQESTMSERTQLLHDLSIHEDEDGYPVLLFTEDVRQGQHYHIELQGSSPERLYRWLGDFLIKHNRISMR